MAEFTTPEFLLNHSVDEVYEKIKAIMPPDIDLSEGSHGFNLTRPAALVAAELCEFILPEVIRVFCPDYSYGEYLDEHAKARGMTRLAATASTGELTITGSAETIIPAGSLFSTASVNDEPSIDYETIEAAIIPEEGTVTVAVRCTTLGILGNTPANTIVIPTSKITGITAVTNPEATTGGTDEEPDESLIERISVRDKDQGESYAGSHADYVRWARSVDGVGDATCIPAQDDTGLVRLIVTDANGAPASEYLCQAVYDYIMSPSDEGARLAPCNAYLSVEPPATVQIWVKASVELTEGATINSVEAAYLEKLSQYLPTALAENEVKLSRVAAALSSTAGVNDFKDVQIGTSASTYGTANIALIENNLPTVALSTLNLTAATV